MLITSFRDIATLGRVATRGLGIALLLCLMPSISVAEETNDFTLKPRPSEQMPRAAESLLLDIERVGQKFIAVGERGHVLVSNGGDNFEQKATPTRATLTAVEFIDANTGWAVGHDAVVIATTDGGEKWQVQHWAPELEKALLDILFVDAQQGFALGAYGLMLQTRNGGKSWQQVENNITQDEWHFTSITRLNDGALLIAGEAGGLALSRDLGATWVQIESPYDGSYFGALPWGDTGALVYGLRGNAFVADSFGGSNESAVDAAENAESAAQQSTDAAEESVQEPASLSTQWQHLSSGTLQSFMGGALLQDGQAALVGVNGTMAVVDESRQVTLLKNEQTLAFSSVVPLSAGRILVTGEGGTHPYEY